ncbi:MAG: indolepyruvate ferredoxin oxidoreductase [Deltaproteobacteria bacterium HGW-Deltaproteobacteria-19]|jgi:indolepyruvate ferredoxin oxidoreductase beta subunit|nr:MAG: indolepyruvate ferredoxin oxidoreductase [Deltaproteobacteria bacterium HGW-Deltaproteobacteria-19]
MGTLQLPRDPYNLIITGVGGQGNVMASRVLSGMLVNRGLTVTIGETFGASQRGGSVMSHIRVSAQGTWSPQIPRGKADVVVALEPAEAVRVLAAYGHPGVIVLSNTRPVYPVGVITGELSYPSLDEIRTSLEELSAQVRLIDATDMAIRLGNPILANIVMIGALAGTGALPLTLDNFKAVMEQTLSGDKLEVNLKAFVEGMDVVKPQIRQQ